MHKKDTRKSVAYIISLLLTIFISLSIVLTITNFTIFKKHNQLAFQLKCLKIILIKTQLKIS